MLCKIAKAEGAPKREVNQNDCAACAQARRNKHFQKYGLWPEIAGHLFLPGNSCGGRKKDDDDGGVWDGRPTWDYENTLNLWWIFKEWNRDNCRLRCADSGDNRVDAHATRTCAAQKYTFIIAFRTKTKLKTLFFFPSFYPHKPEPT